MDDDILEHLERGRAVFLEALQGVTEDAAREKPAPERWSVLECVEHVALAEEYMLSQLEASYSAEPPRTGPGRDAVILAHGADRSRPGKSPKAAEPTGRFQTLAAALEHFLTTRERTLRFVENCPYDLRSRVTTHPLMGEVTCLEMLALMAVHPRRHAAQIREAVGIKNQQ